MGLFVEPLDAPFGALVRGWEPGAPLSDSQFEAVRRALREHLFVLFRGHRIPRDEELVEFARRFGELAQAAELFGVESSHPDILPVTNEPDADGHESGVEGGGILPWHTDYSYLDRPAKESFLEAFAVPGAGGATSFCNMYRAWEALDAGLRTRLGGVRGWHTTRAFMPAKHAEETDEERTATARERKNPYLRDPGPEHRVWHPMAFAHPETGRKALYADSFLYEIEGMSIGDSVQLRDELIAGATHPCNVYRHEWQLGDFILFDAIATLHRRDSFDLTQTRTMRQISSLCDES